MLTAALQLSVLTANGGCNITRLVARKSVPLLNDTMSILRRYEDPDLARQAAPGLLVLLEGLLAQDPDNRRLIELLGRGIYEYTFAFLHGAWDNLRARDPVRADRFRRRARTQYRRVYRLGLRLLAAQDVKLDLSGNKSDRLRAQVARLTDPKYVPGLVLTAVGAGGALLMGIEDAELMQYQGKVPILLERARQLNPRYAQALPDAVLGLFFARAVSLGGNAAKAKRHFERAIALTQRRYLMWLVLYAKHWAWQFQSAAILPQDKRALFVALLDEVRRHELAGDPERLANLLAKRAALRLYPKKDEFLSAEVPPATPRRRPPAKTRPGSETTR